MSEPITSVFNDGYIAQAYEDYRKDPGSVDESWRQFFRFAEGLSGVQGSASIQRSTSVSTDASLLRKAAAAASLVAAIRSLGHMAVQIDPLGSPPEGSPELAPEFYGITEADLQQLPADALGFGGGGTAADVIAKLRQFYSSTLAFEFEHVSESQEREWLREQIESGTYHQPLTADEKKAVLRRLTEVDGLERFLGRAYQGYKRFSIEGTDALVPMLDELITNSANAGAREVAIGMAHRGRINVLTHTLGKPYATIFNEFEGKQTSNSGNVSGDVKYHLGATGKRDVNGTPITVTLVPNPSHLEFVNPVLEGVARAKQGAPTTPEGRDENAVVPVCIHGDAAFPGEGVVAETLNLSMLRGYRTGGTVHIIVNNQVGFTTDPIDSRSTHYASDLAKGYEIPILHVNADDAEACVNAVRLAIAYRTKFKKDFLIDLVGYRRHGHNETDEPAFTQPRLYAAIKNHGSPRQVWGARLVREGVVTQADVDGVDKEIEAKLEAIRTGDRNIKEEAPGPESATAATEQNVDNTGVRAETLVALNEQLLGWPQNLKLNTRLARTLNRRRDAFVSETNAIDWGHAESLAFASLLTDGVMIRISGQDAERGTFSHRQAVLHDSETGETYVPMQHLPQAKAAFEIYNSPLSETAVLGFEYGFSTVSPNALTLWEAQYGDFVNVAQPIIDQFISCDRVKWGQASSLVMLLPHGYEGQGPEHSSARMERYLQLCAEGNMCVAYPSTPAQYFHILRRQARAKARRPLILIQPKSMLRLPEAASKLDDLVNGKFNAVIDDAVASQNREAVRRLVFCTGKVYYDIQQGTNGAKPGENVAVVRVDQLYPWPHDEIAQIVDQYPNIEEVAWVQEEPKNMGAWTFVSPRLRVSTGNALVVRYIGRPERASPAEGYSDVHKVEQDRIVSETLTLPQPASTRRTKATTHGSSQAATR